MAKAITTAQALNSSTNAADSSLAALKAQKEVSSGDGGYTVGPFGRLIPNKQFASMAFAFRDPKMFLYDPRGMIKNPEPGWEYAWPIMDNPETQAKLRGGVYKYVDIGECDPHTSAEVTTQKGIDGAAGSGRVLWYKHVLVKMSPEAWSRQYEAPAAFSQTRLSNEVEAFKEKVTNMSKGVAKPSVEFGVDQGTQ